MAFNPSDSASAPLSVFGGLVTEMAPPDLPEGVSPNCQDVVFAPGVVQSRPAFQKGSVPHHGVGHLTHEQMNTLQRVLDRMLAYQAAVIAAQPQPSTPSKGISMATGSDPIQVFAAAAETSLTAISTSLTAIAALITQLQASPTISSADAALLSQVQTNLTTAQQQAAGMVPPVASLKKK